ncbi:MAG: T9SS type A sorting domain-containing protein [Flavobacteriaceae bacterium]|nr:T9SS type A sorting domain-containing protein [Flavobacteriaceae bacterium]
MKKRIVFCLLLLVGFAEMNSQDYSPLLSDFNEWQLTTCYFGCITDVYYTNGDTIVDSKQYKVLDGFHYISRTFLLREEVSNKQVYLTRVIDENSWEEFLLYDFSLEVGDSIEMMNPITPFPANGGYFTVDSIISRELNDGNEYDHFYFSPSPSNQTSTNNAKWIEGIGSMSIINAPGGDPDINGAGHLSCYFKDGVSVYSNLDSISSCEAFLDIPKLYKPKLELKAVYNAAQNELLIRSSTKLKFIDLYDIRGRRVKSQANFNSTFVGIDTSSLQQGNYILVAYDRELRKRTMQILIN